MTGCICVYVASVAYMIRSIHEVTYPLLRLISVYYKHVEHPADTTNIDLYYAIWTMSQRLIFENQNDLWSGKQPRVEFFNEDADMDKTNHNSYWKYTEFRRVRNQNLAYVTPWPHGLFKNKYWNNNERIRNCVRSDSNAVDIVWVWE